MATEDLCLVCTDGLDYAGVGPCGHKDVCSRCVSRLRFVMEDNRCSLCKAEQPAVFFTRFMGDYTHTLAPDQFARLQVRVRRRGGNGSLRPGGAAEWVAVALLTDVPSECS